MKTNLKVLPQIRGSPCLWQKLALSVLGSAPKKTKFSKKVSSTFSKVAVGDQRTLMLMLLPDFRFLLAAQKEVCEASV